MGYLFEFHDTEIWSPSLLVAEMLIADVREFESRLDISSGLIGELSDTIEVDFGILRGYLLALRNRLNLQHDCFVVHLLALLLCENRPVDEVVRLFPDDWVDEARHIWRLSMRSLGDVRVEAEGNGYAAGEANRDVACIDRGGPDR